MEKESWKFISATSPQILIFLILIFQLLWGSSSTCSILHQKTCLLLHHIQFVFLKQTYKKLPLWPLFSIKINSDTFTTLTWTGWPAGSPTQSRYLRKIKQRGLQFEYGSRLAINKAAVFVAKSFVFFFCCFVKCFGVNFIFNKVGEQRSLLNVDECLSFFFLLLNTCAVVFQKSRRKRRVTGCGRQDFPSTLSSLKVTGAFFFHLPHRFVTMRENNVFSLKRCENCVSAKKKKKKNQRRILLHFFFLLLIVLRKVLRGLQTVPHCSTQKHVYELQRLGK